ncbi:MAG: DUF3179 domain-containing protein [Pseudomonadota bacterium]
MRRFQDALGRMLLAAAGLALVGALGVAASDGGGPTASTAAVQDESPSWTYRRLIVADEPVEIAARLEEARLAWTPAHAPMAIEAASFAASDIARAGLFVLLEEKTGEEFGVDIRAWYQWLWARPERISPDYAAFKADLYSLIDPVFETYFAGRQHTARIRLDEIRWGGVLQDGIPPLRDPDMIEAREARYLDDDNIVFGIEINGDARAYPKRILAWHEMFVDEVGGVEIAGVYCTLCGTVIPYLTNDGQRTHALGTSGFLYRSNKLMYDADTLSLWNTLTGEPVVGPLVDQGVKLEFLSIVTTTWGEWRRRHPDTTVLSLKTGHRRDYGEGVAYQDYFATDRLMFETPFNDTRLKNKQEVLALRFPGAPKDQLAIDTDFLKAHPIYTDRVGFQDVLVLTDSTGANRVYDPQGVQFTSYDRDSTLIDQDGLAWRLSEDALTASDGRTLKRLPAHRAFWFGWRAAFPETRLVRGEG